MKLVTEKQREKLLANGADRGADHVPVVKLFNPCGAGTWIVTELDPEEPSVAFGLADLGFGFPELGCFSLEELQAFRGPFGLGIERDLHFEGRYGISIYAEAARAAGRIVEYGPELDAAARPHPSGRGREHGSRITPPIRAGAARGGRGRPGRVDP